MTKRAVLQNGRWTTRTLSAQEEAAHAAKFAPTVSMVKAEASRRILAIAPETTQRNLIARGVELTKKIVDGGTLTTAEQAEWDAGQSIWTQIKAIRAASNTIEAMNTIPADFAADSYWVSE